MQGSSKLWSLTNRYIANTHNSHHIQVYTHITPYCSSVPLYCLMKSFSGFLFSYQIMSHVTPAETNVRVAVVFYPHV